MSDNSSPSAILPDISHLIKPTCFLSLPSQNPPHPFPLNPPSDIAVDPYLLFRSRFYRHAADLCRTKLLEVPAATLATSRAQIDTVFRLWTIRQAALLMIRMGGIARDESRHLGDLGDKQYRVIPSGESLVPWNLRLLSIRVQAGGDHPQGVTQYYTLAREARTTIQTTSLYLSRLLASQKEQGEVTEDEKLADQIRETQIQVVKWKARLRNLGLFTTAMLMGMRDTKSAVSLLQSIYTDSAFAKSIPDDDADYITQQNALEISRFNTRVVFSLAMIYLQVGDSISARLWFSKLPETDDDEARKTKALGHALCSIADADWDAAEKAIALQINDEKSASPNSHTPFYISLTNNLAVAQINKGNLLESISLLEQMALTGVISPTVLVNLCILYDLKEEVGRKLKNNLLTALREQGFQALENYDFLQ